MNSQRMKILKQLNFLPFLTVDKFNSYFHSNQIAFPLKHLYGSCVVVWWTAWVKSWYSRTSLAQRSTITNPTTTTVCALLPSNRTHTHAHTLILSENFVSSFFFANMNLSTSVWKHTASHFARVQFIKSLWTR